MSSGAKRRMLSSSRSDEFLGTWAVRRLVVDRQNGRKVRFAGTAVVSRDRFEEDGETFAGDMSLRSHRKYVLDFTGDGVAVSFHDLRPFVFISDTPSQRLHHRCGDDDYIGRLFFPSFDSLVEVWRVNGPRKNYTSIAHYHRVDG